MNRDTFDTLFVPAANNDIYFPSQAISMAAYEPINLDPVRVNGELLERKVGK